MKITELLREQGACPEAIVWAQQYSTLEELWYNCRHVEWILWSLQKLGYRDERKLRLFAAACARRQWHLLNEQRSKMAIETAERFADGKASREDLSVARLDAQEAAAESAKKPDWKAAHTAALSAALHTTRSSAFEAAKDASKAAQRTVAWDMNRPLTVEDEESGQADQLRQIIGEDSTVILLRARQLMETSS